MSKRIANVPDSARILAGHVSKSDLLEVAWHLASLVNRAGSCEDDASTLERLIEELQTVPSRIPERVLVSARKKVTDEKSTATKEKT